MNKQFGFVAEPHKNDYWCVSPATLEDDGSVTCHDLAGFCGSWQMKPNGVFFPCETEGVFCELAMEKASTFARGKNE